ASMLKRVNLPSPPAGRQRSRSLTRCRDRQDARHASRRRRSSGVWQRDARILADYLDSFRSFLGNAAGAVEVYRAFLVWLYSSPPAPYLRQAAVPAGIDPWVYPVVLFGRLSGGKTLFTKIAARSMLASRR